MVPYNTSLLKLIIHMHAPLHVYSICFVSLDQLSVQLTGLSTPPADVGLTQINDLLTGSIGSTSWAEESVANELGVASVVHKVWRDSESGGVISDYVIRRSVLNNTVCPPQLLGITSAPRH